MCRRAKMTQWPSSGCRAALGILLAALLGAFLAFTTGTAEACSKHVGPGNFAHSTNIAHEGRHLAQVTAVATTLKPFKAGPEASGAARSGCGCHCSGTGCANGCCAACLGAIDVDSTFPFGNGATAYALSTRGAVPLFRPSPDFRPPRILA
jgi:hypothetical protein